ncbi:tail fiber protein [Pontibacter sp. G13]|uniref:phage tail protein n=1 Tax=Pontibacter sp. G13 TaxID=3074898 RepID=UPI00288B12AB|nr:tail fiber protein [Pontibacter sp. G13]WNJ19941.1 tail fiber protein [Pontibacter sp. G13]
MSISNAYTGEIRPWAPNFAPEGWALCQGQYINIVEFPPLYAILGTQYGGNGVTDFRLPDLRGRIPLHQGGAMAPEVGDYYGWEQIQLLVQNIPAHNHALQATPANGNSASPVGNVLANTLVFDKEYSTDDQNLTEMSQVALGYTGGNQPIYISQPSLVINFIICLDGIFPNRS